MKNKALKFITCMLCIIICFGCFGVSAAVAQKESHGVITVDTVSAIAGDTVTVKVSIDNNPGIAAVTISVKYDSASLTYIDYEEGLFAAPTVNCVTKKSLVRFVAVQNENMTENGILFSLSFKVKDGVTLGLKDVKVEYEKGDFVNTDYEKLTPKTVAGGVKIKYDGENCSHEDYSDWVVVSESTCAKHGTEQRTCECCGHVQQRELELSKLHSYSENWIIDVVATQETQGTMSRHCKYCSSRVDIKKYNYETAQSQKIPQSVGTIVAPSDAILNIPVEDAVSADNDVSVFRKIISAIDGYRSVYTTIFYGIFALLLLIL